MRAVSYPAYSVAPTLGELPDPSCPDGGVLIRVEATGVCRSDWHAWRGHDPVPLPIVPGHEFAGTIAAVGAGVTRWRVGDRVTVPFACGCGQCEVCRAGDTHVCPRQTQPGFTGWGSFAELVAVHAADANVVALPEGVDAVAAAALGCRFATAYRAVVAVGRLAAGEWLAVHGCGGVGLSAVQIGVALGARVVGVDLSPQARAAAERLGAVTVAGGESGEVAAAVAELTGGGAHVSVDAFGSVATMRASVLGLRPRGRHVQVGLLLGDAADRGVPMGRVIGWELEVLGSHGMPSRDYPEMLALVESGRLDPAALVGRVVALEDAGAALMAMDDPSASTVGMTVVDLGR